jgi:hypothetical protein
MAIPRSPASVRRVARMTLCTVEASSGVAFFPVPIAQTGS